MDALIIGPAGGIADALARRLARDGITSLRAITADAADAERATWLLDEAGRPPLVVIVEGAPYPVTHELLALSSANVVLVAEQRAAAARPGALRSRTLLPQDGPGLTVVPLGRAGRRWFAIGAACRHQPMAAERAAAHVLVSAGVTSIPAR
jgi:hypothetical protein